jgi:two-component system chemotaxis response regulator CheB
MNDAYTSAMPVRDVVVIGASAGGLIPLQKLVSGLPPDLAASLFVVMHVPASAPSVLPELLMRAGALRASHARDGDRIEHGHIYVAPPDYQLTLEGTCLRLRQGPRENGSRPAIDPLFRTAAATFGDRVVGIILSGTRTDGAIGMATLKGHGGTTIVQEPEEALYSGMPRAAIEVCAADFVVSIDDMAAIVVGLVREGRAATPALREPRMSVPRKLPEVDPETAEGVPSEFSCPDCHGVLWRLPGKLPRFRCRTGHDYSADALVDAQAFDHEGSLWAALRSAQEWAQLARQLEEDAVERGHTHSARYFAESRARATERARLLREVFCQKWPSGATSPRDGGDRGRA